MSLQNLLIFIPTNLFRIYVNTKFLQIFLKKSSTYSKQIKFISGFACFLITSAGYILFHDREINMITNIVGLLLIAFTFRGNIQKKLFSVFLIYACNMLSDVVIILSFRDYGIAPAINELQGTMTVLLITVCQIISEKIVNKKRNPEYVIPQWVLLLLIPLCSMLMIHYCISNDMEDRNLIVVMGVGLLTINVVSFYLYSTMESVYLTNMENELSLQTTEIYKQQLDIIMNTQDQIRSLQHDMKYHIRELLSMANSMNMKEMVSYLEEMNKATINSDEYSYSGNKELDGNLNYLLGEAHHRLKDVSAKVAIPEGDYIASFDMNVLLSNLLDNAITAAEHSEEQYLHLEIYSEKSLMYITIENSFDGNISEKDGRIISRKLDKTRHGYGLKNVKRIVKKYNGTIDVRYIEKRFYVNIMVYLSNKIE